MVVSGDEFRSNVVRSKYRRFLISCGGVQFSVSRCELLDAVCFSSCTVDFSVDGSRAIINSIDYGGK